MLANSVNLTAPEDEAFYLEKWYVMVQSLDFPFNVLQTSCPVTWNVSPVLFSARQQPGERLVVWAWNEEYKNKAFHWRLKCSPCQQWLNPVIWWLFSDLHKLIARLVSLWINTCVAGAAHLWYFSDLSRGSGVCVLVFFLLPGGFYLFCTSGGKWSLNPVLGVASLYALSHSKGLLKCWWR